MSDDHSAGQVPAETALDPTAVQSLGSVFVVFLPDVGHLPSPERPFRLDGAPAVVRPRQVHGTEVASVRSTGDAGGEADGLWTGRSDLALGIVTADCLPVLLATEGAVAAVHAGWRGLAAGILDVAVDRLAQASGHLASTARITAWIGPAIGPCCFEIQEDVAGKLAERAGSAFVRPRAGSNRLSFDLSGAAVSLLQRRGLEDVRISTVCTRCNPAWSSYRRNGKAAGRNLAMIWRSSHGAA